MNPRPAPPHAWASTSLGDSLGPPFNRGMGGPGGWWILDEPELHLGEDIVVPDLAGWRRERMPTLPETAWFPLAREGVGWLWFVDPEIRTLEAFELREGHWSLLDVVSGNAEVSLPPFDAIHFGLGDLWPDGGADNSGMDRDAGDQGEAPES